MSKKDLPVVVGRKSGPPRPGGGRTVAVTGAEGRYILVIILIPSDCRGGERVGADEEGQKVRGTGGGAYEYHTYSCLRFVIHTDDTTD